MHEEAAMEALMNIVAGARKAHSVGFRPEATERMEIGPGMAGTRVRCTVPLSGHVDERWRTSFRAVQLDDTGFFRFRLEMESNTITFLVTVSRGGGEVAAEMKTLSFLLDSVNALASRS